MRRQGAGAWHGGHSESPVGYYQACPGDGHAKRGDCQQERLRRYACGCGWHVLPADRELLVCRAIAPSFLHASEPCILRCRARVGVMMAAFQ